MEFVRTRFFFIVHIYSFKEEIERWRWRNKENGEESMNLLLFASISLFFSLQKLLIIARLKMTSHYHYCEMKSYCFVVKTASS